MPNVKILASFGNTDVNNLPKVPEGESDWVKTLNRVVNVVSNAQAQVPVYMPFPGGTPTLAGNQLIETARHNAASEALNTLSGGTTGSTSDLTQALKARLLATRTAAAQAAKQGWESYLAELGLEPGTVPNNTKETEQAINKIMTGLRGTIYNQVLGYGGTSDDAASITLDVENLLRTKAGLEPKTEDNAQSYDDVVARIKGTTPKTNNQTQPSLIDRIKNWFRRS